MSFYEDMEKSLTEAIDIEKRKTKLTKRENMPAMTYIAAEEKSLADEVMEGKENS